jgi:hypothetical protein
LVEVVVVQAVMQATEEMVLMQAVIQVQLLGQEVLAAADKLIVQAGPAVEVVVLE